MGERQMIMKKNRKNIHAKALLVIACDNENSNELS